MPELPEVETIRLQLEDKLRGKVIARVFVDRADRIVFDQAAPAKVKTALVGARVTGLKRKGKYLWLELNRRPWVVIHFGMTGNAEFFCEDRFVKAWGGEDLWGKKAMK